jgi:AAA15 family ATPase/GTPase
VGDNPVIEALQFENFFSFLGAQTLDLRAADNVPNEGCHLAPAWPNASERVPKIVALFGANGSGKSNVLRALTFLAWFAKDSFQLQPDAWLPYVPFNGANAKTAPTRLGLVFGGLKLPTRTQENASFCAYTYEVELRGGPPQVASESLRCATTGERSRTLFRRDISEDGRPRLRASRAFQLSGYRVAVDRILRPNASVISTLAQLQHPLCVWLRDAAALITSNILLERSDPTEASVLQDYANSPQLLELLNRDIERIDLGVRAVRIENTSNGPIAYFDHEGHDTALPLHLESHGTRAFVRIFPHIMRALSSGGVAIIDELDSAIHPLLLPEIARWFRDPERNSLNAQLWMTCQNASLLEHLYKEEIYFCTKDHAGRSNMYALADIKDVRRIDNYYRKYMDGVYGAVPHVG